MNYKRTESLKYDMIFLVFDNTSGHLPVAETSKNINFVFLPPNTMPLLQGMD